MKLLGKKPAKEVCVEKEMDAEEKEARSRRGRSARAKGAQFERDMAKRFQANYGIELVRTPQSGGFAKNKKAAEGFKGDIVPVDKNVELAIHIECKSQKQASILKFMEQAKKDCPKGKIPHVVFREYGTKNVYVTLPLEGYFKLVRKIEKVGK